MKTRGHYRDTMAQIRDCLIRLSEGPTSKIRILYANQTNSRRNNELIDLLMDNGLIVQTDQLSEYQYMPFYAITQKGRQLLQLLDRQAELLGIKVD